MSEFNVVSLFDGMRFKTGKKYKYPNSNNVFTLKKVSGFIFHFDCGHWCTDTVFEDLIDIETGLQGFQTKHKQYKLEL